MSLKHKRKLLTLDDLLRLQEEPNRKRHKLSPDVDQQDQDSDGQPVTGQTHTFDSDNDDGESDSAGEETLQGITAEDVNECDNGISDASRLQKRYLDNEGSERINRSSSRSKCSPAISKRQSPAPISATFASLGISTNFQATLASMSIRLPTAVQVACIPPLLQGRDCIGNAKTGSGKTIAFALPILQKLCIDPYGIYALVLTPTRELAFQISEQFAVLGSSMNIRTAVIVGGMDMIAQAVELDNRPHVVVATPGRMVDHLKSTNGNWNLSRVKFLVLDEADRLLTSTFSSHLSYLFSSLPKERQTCLFTATITPSITSIAEAQPRPGKEKPFLHLMKESVETVETLRQQYILVPSHARECYLYHILCNPPESTLSLIHAAPEPSQSSRRNRPSKKKNISTDEEIRQPPPTIIFCNRARTAAYLTALLKSLSIRSTALHSRLTQRERLNSLGLFRSCVVPVLISTDIGARGLDIEEVAMVVNWDLPQAPEEYTHRVGRTARAGRGGVAISFVTERDEDKVIKIEDRIKAKLDEMSLPEATVLDKLSTVSTAKRLAHMELHDSNFGKREEIHKVKRERYKGRDAVGT